MIGKKVSIKGTPPTCTSLTHVRVVGLGIPDHVQVLVGSYAGAAAAAEDQVGRRAGKHVLLRRVCKHHRVDAALKRVQVPLCAFGFQEFLAKYLLVVVGERAGRHSQLESSLQNCHWIGFPQELSVFSVKLANDKQCNG